MKVFISHKREDAVEAERVARLLRVHDVETYLDILDPVVINDGKSLTDHIKKSLNSCTDILVVMSSATKYSQWVPFEIGMAAQVDLPTVTYLAVYVISLTPEFSVPILEFQISKLLVYHQATFPF